MAEAKRSELRKEGQSSEFISPSVDLFFSELRNLAILNKVRLAICKFTILWKKSQNCEMQTWNCEKVSPNSEIKVQLTILSKMSEF